MNTTIMSGPGVKYQSNTISQLSFMNRFTDIELVGIYTASKTNVIIEIFLDKLRASSKVNPVNKVTIDGMAYLVTENLLTQDRVNEILGVLE